MAPEEVERVFRAAHSDETPLGRRDACILALLCLEGIRDRDLLALSLDDYNHRTCELAAPVSSPAEWRVTLAPLSGEAVHNWLELRGSRPGPLIGPLDMCGRLLPRPLSRTVINLACARRARQAGIAPFTCDDFARTLALMRCNTWLASCCAFERPMQLLEPGASGCEAKDAGVRWRNQQLLIAFLARHAGRERAHLLGWLEQFALAASAGTRGAFTFDWLGWAAQPAVPPAPDFGIRGRRWNCIQSAISSLLGKPARPVQSRHRRKPEPMPPIPAAALRAVIEDCLAENSAAGLRDAVLLGLMWETGYSVSRAVRLSIAEARKLVCAHGKSATTSACLWPLWYDALERWLAVRPEGPRPELLVALRPKPASLQEPMTVRAAQWMMERRSHAAGGCTLSPEPLRRSAVWELMRSRT